MAVAALALSAADPAGDAELCRPGSPGPGDPPDLLEAEGEIVESGTAVRWTLAFAEPLDVPDLEGRPFRIDVLVRDPSVPSLGIAYYRELNRIVRFDALQQLGLEILLLPERGQNVFAAVSVNGPKLTMQIPGRMITRDLDLAGLPLEDLRWTVVVRDEHRCDVLGSFRPNLRLRGSVGDNQPPALETGSPAPGGPDDGEGTSGWVTLTLVVGGLVAVGAVLALSARTRR
jgi:hypothetical protein